MVKEQVLYKCEVCGNIVSVLHAGAGELSCCGKPMVELIPNSTDAAKEKHVPVVEKTEDGFKITVGEVIHPMADDHYIQWITFIANDGTLFEKLLHPGDAPEFIIKTNATGGVAYEYCNKHGFWSNQ